MFSVGMIGAGIIGASHLAAVAGHPDTRLAAVADIAPGRAQQAAAPYGAHAYESYEEMLEREKLELLRMRATGAVDVPDPETDGEDAEEMA